MKKKFLAVACACVLCAATNHLLLKEKQETASGSADGIELVDLSSFGESWSRAHRDALVLAFGRSTDPYPKVVGTFLSEDRSTTRRIPLQLAPTSDRWSFNSALSDMVGRTDPIDPLILRFHPGIEHGIIRFSYATSPPATASRAKTS